MTRLMTASATALLMGTTAMAEITTERVTFDVEGTAVVGTLYLPSDHDPATQSPAAVVGGSLTSVKEMMGGTYAEELAERGIMALAIDYRGYGESGGDLRQFEDPAMKAADLLGAVAYLAARPDVDADAVALVGICTSGGNVLYAAAEDPNVGAVATVAGWFVEPSITPMLYGSEARVQELRDAGAAALARLEATGEAETIVAYSDTDETASHVGPMEYYMDDTRGGGVAAWTNALAVASWGPWLDFDPVSRASAVTAPTMILHSDGSALPDQARRVHADLAGPKELFWAEGNHFDFYDDPAHIDVAADAIADFLDRTFAN